jgi:hypothetical protein
MPASSDLILSFLCKRREVAPKTLFNRLNRAVTFPTIFFSSHASLDYPATSCRCAQLGADILIFRSYCFVGN